MRSLRHRRQPLEQSVSVSNPDVEVQETTYVVKTSSSCNKSSLNENSTQKCEQNSKKDDSSVLNTSAQWPESAENEQLKGKKIIVKIYRNYFFIT